MSRCAAKTRTQKPIYRTPAGEQAVMATYDSILAQWPEVTEQLWVETRFGRTHVLALGPRDAQPLVLLHGAGSNALAWGADVPELAKRFRVYLPETPGEPGRSCHDRIPWRGDGVIEWLEDVLAGIGAYPVGVDNARAADGSPLPAATRVLLGGISQGGYLALRFACARPERVAALMLLAPGGVTPVRPAFLTRAVFYSLLGDRGSAALTRYVLSGSEVSDVAVRYMTLIFAHFRSRMDALPLLGDDDLRRLEMPVLLVAGARDPLFDSARSVARVERLVPSPDVRLLPQAGHALVNVAPLLTPFLAVAAP